MKQPLVLRPPYGGGLQVAESGLPSGPPAGRGISLDDSIPGAHLHDKPEGDIRKPNNSDESMYRIDDANDLTKDQSKADQIDHSRASPSYNGLGPSYDTGKTTYPYRDGIPNTHNASAEFVVALWKLRSACSIYLPSESSLKVAARLSEMLDGLNPKMKDRATKCSATLKRVDIPNLRWIFSVDCGNGPKAVYVKASRKGNTTKLAKMDLMVSCSCPAWQWLGPEHHAIQNGYLERGPRGTASVPFIRDPQNHNLVCKHVAAALNSAKGWDIPVKKKKE